MLVPEQSETAIEKETPGLENICVCTCVCRLHVGGMAFNNRINLLAATVSFFQELSKMRFFLQPFTVGFRIFYIILGSVLPALVCALA